MQSRFLNYYFYLKLASYKQQQPFLVEKLTVTFVCASR